VEIIKRIQLSYLIILGIGVGIGIVDSILRLSIFPFFSWSFIASWIIGTIYYIQKIRFNQRFNVRLNQVFFIFWPNMMGTATLAFGSISVILNESILGVVHFSIFTLILALPYQIIGYIFIWKSLGQYRFVFFQGKEKNAKAVGFFFLTFFMIIYFSIVAFVSLLDLLALIFGLAMLILFIERIVYHSTHRAILVNSSPRRARSRNTARGLDIPAPALSIAAEVPPVTSRTRPTQRQNTRTPRRVSTRSRQTTPRRNEHGHARRPSVNSPLSSNNKNKKDKKILDLLPTGMNIDINDFKCLFCFEIPNTNNRNRKIVICPKCKRPAHLDEWNAWKTTSPSCPRCNAKINGSQKIVSSQTYVKVVKYFSKNKEKFKKLTRMAVLQSVQRRN